MKIATPLRFDDKGSVFDAKDRLIIMAAGNFSRLDRAIQHEIVHRINSYEALLEAVKANHKWHVEYDDDGYPDSWLEELNNKAIAQAEARP